MSRRTSAYQTDFNQTLFASEMPLAVRESAVSIADKRTCAVPVYAVQLVQHRVYEAPAAAISGPGDAAIIAADFLREADREHLITLLLDAKNRVIGIHTVSIGDLTSSIAHPRETYKAAILANSASIIVAHNHPSGDPTPSPDDLNVTRRLASAGETIGIELLDHIVIGARGVFISLKERGYIAERTASYGVRSAGWLTP